MDSYLNNVSARLHRHGKFVVSIINPLKSNLTRRLSSSRLIFLLSTRVVHHQSKLMEKFSVHRSIPNINQINYLSLCKPVYRLIPNWIDRANEQRSPIAFQPSSRGRLRSGTLKLIFGNSLVGKRLIWRQKFSTCCRSNRVGGEWMSHNSNDKTPLNDDVVGMMMM